MIFRPVQGSSTDDKISVVFTVILINGLIVHKKSHSSTGSINNMLTFVLFSDSALTTSVVQHNI